MLFNGSQTKRRRELTGSPQFKKKNTSALPASGTTVFSFDERATASEKYAPFNKLVLINNSAVNLEFHINQDPNNVVDVPKGTIRALDSGSAPAVRSVRVVNLNSTTQAQANTIIVQVERVVLNTQDIVGGIVRKIFGGSSV